MYNSKRLENWILWKRFISLYKLVLINYCLLVTVNYQDFHCNSIFPHTSKSGSNKPFSNYNLVFFFPQPAKHRSRFFEYQLAIYGSHKIQEFINITQTTTEVPGQTSPTFMGKGVGFKSGKYYMNYINTLFLSFRNQNGENPTAILPNTT